MAYVLFLSLLSVTVRCLSFLTFFIHLLVSLSFIFRSERASSPQFSALLKGAICSPAQWRHTTRGSRLKPGDWNQKNTEWGFFFPIQAANLTTVVQVPHSCHYGGTSADVSSVEFNESTRFLLRTMLRICPVACAVMWPQQTLLMEDNARSWH